MEEKLCASCKIKKSLDLFYKDKSRKDGIGAACKKCNYKYKCVSIKKNPEKKKKSDKKYRSSEKIKKRMKEYRKKYYQKNKIIMKKRALTRYKKLKNIK